MSFLSIFQNGNTLLGHEIRFILNTWVFDSVYTRVGGPVVDLNTVCAIYTDCLQNDTPMDTFIEFTLRINHVVMTSPRYIECMCIAYDYLNDHPNGNLARLLSNRDIRSVVFKYLQCWDISALKKSIILFQ